MNIFETTNYSNASSYNFGSVYVEDILDKNFFIQNNGTANLTLTGSPIVSISGVNTEKFIITQPTQNNIASSESISFLISFAPLGLETYTAAISIANNDTNNNPYIINLIGSGTNIIPP